MSEKAKERMLELLADRAMSGLSDPEQVELADLQIRFPELASDDSFELAAAAFALSGVDKIEPIPAALRDRLDAEAERFIGTISRENALPAAEESGPAPVASVRFERPRSSFIQWLGWGFAAAACIALVFNIWLTRFGGERSGPEIARTEATPKQLTPSERLSAFLASANDVVKSDWSSPVEDEKLSGEVVWSDKEQKGFMVFKGLPPNNASKETYQLWIFDETQDDKTPIDGGIFDVSKDGEVVVPIDAKLHVSHPKMFAVTVEKPGGVVVSKREKIVALAKV